MTNITPAEHLTPPTSVSGAQISDLSDECIRLILAYLPVASLLQAGLVCSSWRTQQLELVSRRQSLVLYDDNDQQSYRHRPVFHYDDQRFNLYEAHDAPATPTGKLSILRVNTAALVQFGPSASGLSRFVSLTSLDIQWSGQETVATILAPLLYFFSAQLTSLALYLTFPGPEPGSRAVPLCTSSADLLFGVINLMPALQTLDLRLSRVQPSINLSILGRLRRFVFFTDDVEPDCRRILEPLCRQWAEYVRAREPSFGPLEVHFLRESFTHLPFDDTTTSTTLPLTQCITRLGSFWCRRLEQLPAQFPALTHLRMSVKSPNGYRFLLHLFGTLSRLPALAHLQLRAILRETTDTTFTVEELKLKQQQLAQLSLPRVHVLAVHLIALATGFCHADLANIAERCPALQHLTAELVGGCTDCQYQEWLSSELAADSLTSGGQKTTQIGHCLTGQLQALGTGGRLPALQSAVIGTQGVVRQVMVVRKK